MLRTRFSFRAFHSSRPPHGWNQAYLQGAGLPIRANRCPRFSHVQSIHREDILRLLKQSSEPRWNVFILVQCYESQDAVLFASGATAGETGYLLNNQIVGPDAEFDGIAWRKMTVEEKSELQRLVGHVDFESDFKQPKEGEISWSCCSLSENPFKDWWQVCPRKWNGRIQDLFGIYVMGLP